MAALVFLVLETSKTPEKETHTDKEFLDLYICFSILEICIFV